MGYRTLGAFLDQFGIIAILPSLETLLRPEVSNSYTTEGKSLILAKPNQ